MGVNADIPMPLAPFQAIRIRRLLAGFLLGHLLLLPLMLAGIVGWLLWAQQGIPDVDLLFEIYENLFYMLLGLICWRSLKRQGLSLKLFVGRVANYSGLAFTGLAGMFVFSAFGLALPNELIRLALNAPMTSGLPELWAEPGLLAASYNLLSFSSTVLLAPFVEELLFRGIFLHRLTVKWGLRDAIVVSSLIFGLLHGLSLFAICFGFVMSLLYVETGSLRLTICCHSLHNAIIFSLAWLSACHIIVLSSDAMLELDTLFLAIGGAALLFWFYRHEQAWNCYPPFLLPVTPAGTSPAE